MNMNNDAAEFGLIMHGNLRRKKVGLGPLRLLSFLGITMGVLILMAMAAPSARAALETYYDFENNSLTSDGGLQSTNITGTVGIVGPEDFGSGTNVNAVTLPSTDHSLFTEAEAAGTPASFTLGGLTTTGLTDVNLSFALLSGGTGAFTDLSLRYSIDGGATFSAPFATVSNLTSYTTYTGPPTFSFDVSTLSGGLVDNVSGSKLFFEFSFSGPVEEARAATFVDNIQVTAVPEPSSYIGALFGLVGLCWFQRRWLMTRLLSLRQT
jgi:hypothetical protein